MERKLELGPRAGGDGAGGCRGPGGIYKPWEGVATSESWAACLGCLASFVAHIHPLSPSTPHFVLASAPQTSLAVHERRSRHPSIHLIYPFDPIMHAHLISLPLPHSPTMEPTLPYSNNLDHSALAVAVDDPRIAAYLRISRRRCSRTKLNTTPCISYRSQLRLYSTVQTTIV